MAFTEDSTSGLSNGTSDVTVVAAPSAGERKVIKTITVHNNDTATAIVTIMYDDTSTQRNLIRLTLDSGDMLVIDDPLILGTTSDSIVMKLDGAVTTNELHYTAHYGVTS